MILIAYRRCSFCGEPAEFSCDWTVDAIPMLVPVRDLKPREFVYLTGDASPAAAVMEVNEKFVRLVVKGRRGDAHYETIPVANQSGVNVMRPGPCGKAVCFRHVRELSDQNHVCHRHVQAQDALIQTAT